MKWPCSKRRSARRSSASAAYFENGYLVRTRSRIFWASGKSRLSSAVMPATYSCSACDSYFTAGTLLAQAERAMAVAATKRPDPVPGTHRAGEHISGPRRRPRTLQVRPRRRDRRTPVPARTWKDGPSRASPSRPAPPRRPGAPLGEEPASLRLLVPQGLPDGPPGGIPGDSRRDEPTLRHARSEPSRGDQRRRPIPGEGVVVEVPEVPEPGHHPLGLRSQPGPGEPLHDLRLGPGRAASRRSALERARDCGESVKR